MLFFNLYFFFFFNYGKKIYHSFAVIFNSIQERMKEINYFLFIRIIILETNKKKIIVHWNIFCLSMFLKQISGLFHHKTVRFPLKHTLNLFCLSWYNFNFWILFLKMLVCWIFMMFSYVFLLTICALPHFNCISN